jgi:hypothetical protein
MNECALEKTKNMECPICYEEKKLALQCTVCHHALCFDCDYQIWGSSCPFCRRKTKPSWSDILKRATVEQILRYYETELIHEIKRRKELQAFVCQLEELGNDDDRTDLLLDFQEKTSSFTEEDVYTVLELQEKRLEEASEAEKSLNALLFFQEFFNIDEDIIIEIPQFRRPPSPPQVWKPKFEKKHVYAFTARNYTLPYST